MTTYEYKILIGRDAAGGTGGVTWYLDEIGQPVGSELPSILNRLGAEGWRVAGLGELKRWVLQFGEEAEVLRPLSLRKEVATSLDRARGLYRRSAAMAPTSKGDREP